MTGSAPGGHDWGLLDPLGHAAITGDDALLAAMVRVEVALIRAWGDDAPVFDVAAIDRAALIAGGRQHGNPVIALVEALRAQAGDAATGVHRGATSQDVLDSAFMLVAADAVATVRASLVGAGADVAELADAQRATPMAGRTLSQHAAPTTFGARAAGWLEAITEAIEGLDALVLPVQFGGAVGTGAAIEALGGDPVFVRAALAAELGLADPGRAWHTDRIPIARLASAVGIVIGALGRIGADLVALGRTEVAEVHTADEGRSSAMPQKRNPVSAVLLVAASRRSPQLVATLFGALESVDERPPGAWHAEWAALRSLLDLAVGSAAAAASTLAGVTVDTERMLANLALTGDAIHAESAKHGRADGTRTAVAVSGPIVDAAIQRFRSVQ